MKGLDLKGLDLKGTRRLMAGNSELTESLSGRLVSCRGTVNAQLGQI